MTVLRFVPRGTGFAWLFSVFCSLAAWIVFLASKNNLPFLFTGQLFSDIAIDTVFPAFQIDLIVWPMILSVLAIVAGTILSSATRIGFGATTFEWIGVLLLGVIGTGACASQNVLTTLVFISLLDLFEVFLTLTSPKQDNGKYLFLFWRLASLLILFAVYSLSSQAPQSSSDWEMLGPIPAQLTLIACIMRMGISPVKSVTGTPCDVNNGIDLSRNLIGLVISVTIVVQLPVFSGNNFFLLFLLLFLLVSMTAKLLRIRSNGTESNLVLWQSFGGSVICAEYLYGYSASAIMFLIAFIPISYVINQVYRQGKFFLIIGVLASICFSGLPFTPNSMGLNGFTTSGVIPGSLFVIILIPLFFLVISIILSETRVDYDIERWAATISPLGSLVLVISSWLIFLLWQPNTFTMVFSIQGLIITLGGVGVFIAVKYKLFNLQPQLLKIGGFSKSILTRLNPIQNSTYKPSYSIINKAYAFIINLFESDGGILWAILCLVLIITIISGSGVK